VHGLLRRLLPSSDAAKFRIRIGDGEAAEGAGLRPEAQACRPSGCGAIVNRGRWGTARASLNPSPPSWLVQVRSAHGQSAFIAC